MQIVKTILITTIVTNTGVMAMTSKAKNDENKVVYEVLTGDTNSVQGKPALAVDVNYKSQHVDVGVKSDVSITISTRLTKGILKVNLRSLNEKSIDLEERDLEFTLTKGTNSFPIKLKVSSSENGIHYINLTMSVEGEGSRVVVIPVNVGTISHKVENKALEKTGNGVVISVSNAEEEIK